MPKVRSRKLFSARGGISRHTGTTLRFEDGCTAIVGSALCAVASSVQALTAFRIFQGVGGGALLPVGMAIIFRLFDPAERAAATSMLMIPLLLGPAFGPT